VKTLKQKVNFCNSSLNQKQKLRDKYEPREIVEIGEAIGVGVGLSLDLVFKAVPWGLLGIYCRSLVVVVVGGGGGGGGGAAAAAAVVVFAVVVIVVVVVVVVVASGAIVDCLQLLTDLIFKRYCVLLL